MSEVRRRALMFTDEELSRVLAAVRTGRGLYYTTHGIPDPQGIGSCTIDQVIGLIEEEIGRRPTGSSRHPLGSMSRKEMLAARALFVAVRCCLYAMDDGPPDRTNDRHIDLILDLVLDEMDRIPDHDLGAGIGSCDETLRRLKEKP